MHHSTQKWSCQQNDGESKPKMLMQNHIPHSDCGEDILNFRNFRLCILSVQLLSCARKVNEGGMRRSIVSLKRVRARNQTRKRKALLTLLHPLTLNHEENKHEYFKGTGVRPKDCTQKYTDIIQNVTSHTPTQ